MVVSIRWPVLAVAAGMLISPVMQAERRSLTILFGPASTDNARQGAHAAAGAARRWLRTADSEVELRRAGSTGTLAIDAKLGAKAIEQAFAGAAMQARDTDPATFLTALDSAAQAAALRPGQRLVVAVLNSPPLSSEAEQSLANLVDLCRERGVRVIVLDIAPDERTASALESLTKGTGGKLVRQARALQGSVDLVAPAAAGKAVDPAVAAQQAPIAAAAGSPFPIPVHARFIRTSSTAAIGGTMDHFVGGNANNNNLATGARPRGE